MMDNRIKFRHLRCFVEVVRLQSVSRAAEELNLAQPAVSRYITELEDIVGTCLVSRGRSGCHLTPLGERFFESVAPGLETIRKAYLLMNPEGESVEMIALGVLPTVSAGFLPQVIDRLKKEEFRPQIRVIEGTNVELLGCLRRGEVALVIGRLGTAEMMHGLAFEHLYSEPIQCFVRPGHPILERDMLTTRDITEWPIVLNLPGSVVRAEVDSHLHRKGVSLSSNVVEVNSPLFSRRFTLMGDRIWVSVRGVVKDDIDDGALVPLNIQDWDINGSVGLTTNPNVQLNSSVKHIIGSIRDESKGN